ncbi:hypothetical protein E2C01_088860 [Portunus trituberculatus]|uniref:Uncharacterized protein n=1 Tax=Portunus trituberculatus TaxID=210409 RepID=A0A5B7JAG6_PORTR|nr:hypothetical protein [Portunus trituberculatus]
MESSDDIITAILRGPTVSKSAVQPDRRPPMTSTNGNNSHHLLVSHGQTLQKACPSTAPK